jgi:hypothetical protein
MLLKAGIDGPQWSNEKAVIKSRVGRDSSIPGRVARLLPVWRKGMLTPIRPACTIMVIGLSEPNTIA